LCLEAHIQDSEPREEQSSCIFFVCYKYLTREYMEHQSNQLKESNH
jgi:hypothetical protein